MDGSSSNRSSMIVDSAKRRFDARRDARAVRRGAIDACK
jgi:hypothetical protein